MDSNGINYTTTSSQSVTAQAKDELKNYIRGRISSNVNEIVASTFTSFAPFSLQDSFEFSSAVKRDGTLDESKNIEKLKSWKINLTRNDIDQLFSNEIYPVCVSKGEEWFFTAISVKDKLMNICHLKPLLLRDFLILFQLQKNLTLKEAQNLQLLLQLCTKQKVDHLTL